MSDLLKDPESPPRQVEVQVARRIRRLRLDKKLTLRRLASLSGMSDSYLSRVENHNVAIPLANLDRLAGALNVPIPVFFETDEAVHPLCVCRAGRGIRGRIRGKRGFVYEMLAAEKKGKLMEPLVVDIASASRLIPVKAHSGEELDYVLNGEFDLIYGKERIRLREGDAVYYDATVPHAARPIKGKPCRILAVVASRDYLFHGDLTRLLKG